MAKKLGEHIKKEHKNVIGINAQDLFNESVREDQDAINDYDCNMVMEEITKKEMHTLTSFGLWEEKQIDENLSNTEEDVYDQILQ